MSRNPVSLGLLALAMLLTVSLAVPLAQFVWHALGHFPEIGPFKNVSVANRQAQSADLTPIFTLAPFGVAAPSGPLAVSTGSLSLRGVILAKPPSRSTALISDAGRPVKVFGVGDSLPDGSVLESVESDHVVLRVSGRRASLGFAKLAAGGVAPAVAATTPILPAAAFYAPAGSKLLPDEVIDVYRQRIAADPKAVIDDLGVSATPEGYRVGAIVSPQLRRAGLQSGDLIVRINGKTIGNMEQDRANFDDIALSDTARVEIIRGARLLILSFPLR